MNAPKPEPRPEPTTLGLAFEDYGLKAAATIHGLQERISVLEAQLAVLRDAQTATDELIRQLLSKLRDQR
jgi:hypothetical protein